MDKINLKSFKYSEEDIVKFKTKKTFLSFIREGVYYVENKKIPRKTSIYAPIVSPFFEKFFVSNFYGKILELSNNNGKLLTRETLKMRKSQLFYGVAHMNPNFEGFVGKVSFLSNISFDFLRKVINLNSKIKGLLHILNYWESVSTFFEHLSSKYPIKFNSRSMLHQKDYRLELFSELGKTSNFRGYPQFSVDDYTCFLCGSHSNLTTHHLIPQAFFNETHKIHFNEVKKIRKKERLRKSHYHKNDPKNEVKVCESCHKSLEKVFDNFYNLSSKQFDYSLSLLDFSLIPAKIFMVNLVLKVVSLNKDENIFDEFVDIMIKEENKLFD